MLVAGRTILKCTLVVKSHTPHTFLCEQLSPLLIDAEGIKTHEQDIQYVITVIIHPIRRKTHSIFPT